MEHNESPIPYGAILTEILKLDIAAFQKTLDRLEQVVEAKDYTAAPRAYMDVLNTLGSLPLYRLYLEDFRAFGEWQVEGFVVGEARDAFAEFVIEEDRKLSTFVQQTFDDIRFIQRRYAWFLDSMAKDKQFEKKKGQRKESLAEQITAHLLDTFVSGISLGEDSNVDAPNVKTQYAVRSSGKRGPELVEKMYFDRLIDFIYVEFMKGLQKGFVPKRCVNCNRWFLQEPGATYSYCNELAPGKDGKTCREIEATTSFRGKVQNNDVWKVHQRAYKKYFARTRSGTMTRPEFEVWSREAERLRNNALDQYEQVETQEEKDRIVKKLTAKLNSR